MFTWPSVGLASPRKGGWGLEDMRQHTFAVRVPASLVQGDGEAGPQGEQGILAGGAAPPRTLAQLLHLPWRGAELGPDDGAGSSEPGVLGHA